MTTRIGFIGAGQMAEALARGFIAKGVAKAENICCTDVNPDRKEVFRSFFCNPVESNAELVKASDVIFIAVKPQYVGVVLRECKEHLEDRHVIVSIAAGVTLQTMKDAAGANRRLVRVMPNTPCLVGETAAAMCLGGTADDTDAETVGRLFDAVGKIYRVDEKLLSTVTGLSGSGPSHVLNLCEAQVDEKLLSAVTGLSGSGPAYVFMMIEALADGGVRSGLPRDIAQQLAAQTVLGSAKMVLETGKHPGTLKDMVTSPAGTTIAGVHELEKAGTRAAFINAVYAATNRADELSKM